MKNKTTTAILLAAIVATGLLVRVVRLDRVPPGFYIDEASFGYNAYSILKTGRDEYNNFLPLYTPSFGTGKNPVYLYATVASEALLGMNEFAERLPAALFGAAAVWIAYLLGAAAFNRRSAGLLAALFLALDPWHLFMSRFGVEMTSMTFLIAAGALLLLKGTDRRDLLPWGGLMLALSTYAYAPAMLFSPLIFAAFTLCYRHKIVLVKSHFAVAAAIFIALLSPHAIGKLKPPEQLKHFQHETIANPDNFDRESNALSKSVWPLNTAAPLANPGVKMTPARRAAFMAAVFANNYISYFSPSFLFIRGDRSTWRASVKEFGQLYLIAIPLLLIGIAGAAAARSPGAKFMLWWLALYPVAASITVQTFPQATRGITAIPCLEIIAAVGVVTAFDRVRALTKKNGLAYAFAAAFIAVYLFSAGLFVRHYFTEYPEYSSYEWNAGYREAFKYADDNSSRYDYVIISWNIPYSYIYPLFYTKFEPKMIQEHPLNLYQAYPVGTLGNYVVGSPYLWAKNSKLLYIVGIWERPDLKTAAPLPTGSIVKLADGAERPAMLPNRK